MKQKRDHGGGLDAAIGKFGGTRESWLDLSTGINPVPYPIGDFSADAWTALPDAAAFSDLENAARSFWNIPDNADVLAAPGASALIAQLPRALQGQRAYIPGPTYNEHAAAFVAADWSVSDHQNENDTYVLVHPNNPDGRLWDAADHDMRNMIIDESFCDVMPQESAIAIADQPRRIVLKSFGKFWGLAGLRLGFAIGDPNIIAKLRTTLGPWQVSGPALQIGTRALSDHEWANETRHRLQSDCQKLDTLMGDHGAALVGGTSLFRLYDTDNAQGWQDRLAKNCVWSRIFPYSDRWLRLGIPHPDRWDQLAEAL